MNNNVNESIQINYIHMTLYKMITVSGYLNGRVCDSGKMF